MDLRTGDCLEVMKDLNDNSVDIMFADLPYCQTKMAWDLLIDLELFWKEINRVCKDDAPMIFTCTTKFGNSLINSNPKNFRYDLIWIKSASTGFLNSKKAPLRKHEMIYIFYRKLPKVYTENIALHHQHKFLNDNKVVRTDKGCDGLYGKESQKVFIYDDKGKLRNNEPRYEPPLPNSVIRDTNNYTNNSVLYGNIKRPDCMRKNNESMYNPPLPNSILEIKSEKRKHSTQKPVPLMEWILKYYSREGDVVLDPTMGSGSMGVACMNMNRLFIGIEKDEAIFDVAFNRLNKT